MTTQNSGEKEQGMSEVYTAELQEHGTFAIARNGTPVEGLTHYVTGILAKRAADAANLAHAHATAAAARRVRELEEALEHIVEYWNRGENNGAMSDALYHMIDTAESALAGKERTDGAE